MLAVGTVIEVQLPEHVESEVRMHEHMQARAGRVEGCARRGGGVLQFATSNAAARRPSLLPPLPPLTSATLCCRRPSRPQCSPAAQPWSACGFRRLAARWVYGAMASRVSPTGAPGAPIHSAACPVQVVHRVSLKKIPFRIVSQPGGQQQQANAAAADVHQGQALGAGVGPPKPTRGAEQQQQQQQGEQDGMRDGTAADAFPRSTAAAIEAFAAAVESDPAAFLQPTAELAALAKAAAKALYEYQATLEGTLKSSNGAAASDGGHAAVLPELYVDGFDAEQIWLQLELAVPPALQRARKLLKKAGQQPQLVTPEMEEAIDGAALLGGRRVLLCFS